MVSASALSLGLLIAAGFPSPRVAVVLDDAQAGQPVRAAIEETLIARGMEVVSADVAERIRKSVTPEAILAQRLPEGLSVLEADAILGGSVNYGELSEFEGSKSGGLLVSLRLIDLGTGRVTATLTGSGRGLGAPGPAIWKRAAKHAVGTLFDNKALADGLASVGQASGMVTLIVQDIERREQLLELRRQLERALGGAPVKEIYFAKGLGKLLIGGSKSKSMVGPDIADVLTETKSLALIVEEVANTRLVARYHRARAVSIHALVLEPKMPKREQKRATELGRFVATQFATFEYAKASYQAGKLSRAQAIARAKKLGADVLVESELLGSGDSAALAIRVVDVKTGKPILREQRLLEDKASLETARAVLAQIKTSLPDQIDVGARGGVGSPQVAEEETAVSAREKVR